MIKRILICGDSFSADWTIKYQQAKGWPNFLADQYLVTNLSQAGCSEFKIWKQLSSANLLDFDCVILSHTSPFRIPIEEHPDHKLDVLHKNCDLIYLDVKNSKDKDLKNSAVFFEKFFSLEYANFIHYLIIKQEIEYLKSFTGKIIHISNVAQDFEFPDHKFISFESVFKKYRGTTNHYNKTGNQLVFDTINKLIT